MRLEGQLEGPADEPWYPSHSVPHKAGVIPIARDVIRIAIDSQKKIREPEGGR